MITLPEPMEGNVAQDGNPRAAAGLPLLIMMPVTAIFIGLLIRVCLRGRLRREVTILALCILTVVVGYVVISFSIDYHKSRIQAAGGMLASHS